MVGMEDVITLNAGSKAHTRVRATLETAWKEPHYRKYCAITPAGGRGVLLSDRACGGERGGRAALRGQAFPPCADGRLAAGRDAAGSQELAIPDGQR